MTRTEAAWMITNLFDYSEKSLEAFLTEENIIILKRIVLYITCTLNSPLSSQCMCVVEVFLSKASTRNFFKLFESNLAFQFLEQCFDNFDYVENHEDKIKLFSIIAIMLDMGEQVKSQDYRDGSINNLSENNQEKNLYQEFIKKNDHWVEIIEYYKDIGNSETPNEISQIASYIYETYFENDNF